eukprot:TRINITY_DN2994_c0_g1_i8.p1 TRINITY_DN2994_c0_g1~~TRINITY_DN2994_c0_g1_i8.p1  ORF type:complete len:202 (+),score=37.01 TRINITY_DN2994_c0_g1_i8:61-666(+)
MPKKVPATKTSVASTKQKVAQPTAKKPSQDKKAPKEKKAPQTKKATQDKKVIQDKQVLQAKKASQVKKALQVKKAIQIKKAVQKGAIHKKRRSIRTSVHFIRPQTLRLLRKPKYPRKSVPSKNPLNQYSIIKYPLGTESAMKNIEDNRTLVFIVDIRSDKRQIKDAVKKLYDVQAEKVNTLIRYESYQRSCFVDFSQDLMV